MLGPSDRPPCVTPIPSLGTLVGSVAQLQLDHDAGNGAAQYIYFFKKKEIDFWLSGSDLARVVVGGGRPHQARTRARKDASRTAAQDLRNAGLN